MSKFKYNPEQYKNFGNPVKNKIIDCFCVCGITPDLVQNSRNIQKDCFKKFSCLNLIKNKLEKTFYIKVNKSSLKNCRDIYDAYSLIIPLIKSDKEYNKAVEEAAMLFIKRTNEIRWHYVDNDYIWGY